MANGSATTAGPPQVEAHDEREPIGGGTHQRVVVSVARFDERVQRKLRR